jgi:iron complex outermembrane recepter protein
MISSTGTLHLALVTSVSALAMLASPALAQTAAADAAEETGIEEIIVTAQRQSQSLQDVPIAVSAFSAAAIEAQQIENASDLQLTLPNVVFSKGNFTGSSFTIRGIGDLCVGTSCDSATAIHVNGTPLIATRLFETEYFDLERIEVLRGPQGTLFGRNATSGVVNFITAKPDMDGLSASADGEYGNFNAYKIKGMVNVPLGETLAARVTGYFQKRDGYTENLFNNTQVDGREQYAVRGSLRWEPTETTRVDLMAYYFREKDNRSRIQKQLCQRDPSGVLGCLNSRRDFGATNSNSTFVGVLSSREFLAINGIPSAFGLGSLYGPDTNASFVNPADVRQVRTDFTPEYFTDEQQYQARIEQEAGQFKIQLTGFYQETRVNSRVDYNLNVADRSIYAAGLGTLAAAAAGGIPGLPASFFAPIAAAIIPGGPAGQLCTSDTDLAGVGSFGGNKICGTTPLDFDKSSNKNRDWSLEGIIRSDFDGKFNFLVGGIYLDSKTTDTEYYVNAFGIDYVTGLLGSFGALGRAALGIPNYYLGTPYFRNSTPNFDLKSYGIFGEAYYNVNDRLKLTVGLRYNNDKKDISARSTLASFPVPYTATSAFASPFVNGFNFAGAPASAGIVPFDADPKTPCTSTASATGVVTATTGCELFQNRSVGFSEFTGRAVLDFKIDDDHLLYASYSRGYKSGGINPPLQPIFAVSDSFTPEFVDSFEIGSKNTFLDGSLRLNLTGFLYKYKSLQLSRIVARTSVNDNVDAEVYGLEADAIIKPSPEILINMGASYLHTKVSQDKFLGNPRDPGGSRADAVIIKDVTNGSNCAVVPTVAGNAAGTNQLVGAINAGLGLRAPAPFLADGGIASTGAFGICGLIAGTIANPPAGLRTLFATPTGALAFTVENAGVPVNIKGNRLPQAPNYKFSLGAQYTFDMSNGMTVVPRGDFTYTGESFGNIFNGGVNRIAGYSQINAQIQVNGKDDKWYVRGFIQNLSDNNATTGLYVTDQSSGLFTNIFTLEPRRYGIAGGIKF